ncbi:MAG: M1 family peptidase, partial [Ignavibacteria bacterium]
MNRFKYILLLTIALSAAALSQELYIPLEFQAAYEDGTRSPDGKPGPEYWQNSADYKLSVILDPAAGKITGSGTIIYNNNSPDILDRIVIRLYQNLNKAGTLKDFPFNDKEFTDGIVIRSLTLNKRSYDVMSDTSLENTGTNIVIKNLNVLPKKQVTISVSWDFTIPKVNKVRMGQYDSTTFFIAYWYPQIAVYDDIDGWDMTEYTGNAEFYNDFNNYDIKITVPNNYCIWATGELQNPDELFSPHILARYKEALGSFKIVNIITAQDYLLKMSLFKNSAE